MLLVIAVVNLFIAAFDCLANCCFTNCYFTNCCSYRRKVERELSR